MLKFALGSVLTGLIFALARAVTNQARAHKSAFNTQRIRPSLVLILLFGGVCFTIGGIALWAGIAKNGGLAAFCLGSAFVFGGVMFMAGRLHYSTIEWDEVSITGPGGYYPRSARYRNTILWSNIVDCGIGPSGNWFVKDSSGKKILWNWFYTGYDGLLATVEIRRPDLFDEVE